MDCFAPLGAALLCAALAAILLTSEGLEMEPDIEEMTIPVGADLTLKCSHDSPFHWQYPHMNETKEIEYGTDQNGTYLSNLYLKNAIYSDTGYYICIGENISKEIYIYVRDENELFAVKEIGFIFRIQYQDLEIPCKPTSPDVNVTLWHNGKMVKHVEYNVKKGFLIRNVQPVNAGDYKCHGVRNEHFEEVHFNVIINRKTWSIGRPTITVRPSSNVILGQKVVLECSIKTSQNILVNLTWKSPDVNIAEMNQSEKVTRIDRQFETKRTLTINNVTEMVEGKYICEVTDTSKNSNETVYFLKPFHGDMKYLNLTMEGPTEISVRYLIDKAVWTVKIAANPKAHIVWHKPDGSELQSIGKYKVETSSDQTKVTIDRLTMSDSGIYSLKATNGKSEETLNVTLLVEGKPIVKWNLNKKIKYMLNETYTLSCAVKGFPVPQVEILFTYCTNDLPCVNTTLKDNEHSISNNFINNHYSVNIKATRNGHVICKAKNQIGFDTDIAEILIYDIIDGYNVWREDSLHEIIPLDNITIGCGASIHDFSEIIEWFYRRDGEDFKIIPEGPDKKISFSKTAYSYRSTLHISKIGKEDSGYYSCKPRNSLTTDFKFTFINVKDPQKPNFTSETNMNCTTWTIEAGKEDITFICKPYGVPLPDVTWFKDDQEFIVEKNNSKITLTENNTKLTFNYIALEDAGKYTCKAISRVGNASKYITIEISDPQRGNYVNMIVIVIVFFLVGATIVFILCMKVRREQKLRKELTDAGLYNFCEGQIESLNPELNIHEQADLLPYDKKWEFPREKLKLGKQLGSGAFGVVLKAEAYGLKGDDEPTIVAVKMVQKNSDFALIKALASELKIMANLGQHLNVLNLLGACTGNINKRELLVLVEYCRYGNLHNYLLKHREAFINQVNQETGSIEAFSRNKIELSYSDNKDVVNTNNTSNYSNCQTVNTDMTSISAPEDEDGYLVSKDLENCRSNYQGDYKLANVKPICTQDLLCWGYQISRGMEHLALRKVLHGDLAARNILLAEGNIVKICDFGLAKSMYNSGNYCKKGNGPLPVKWMSIEALRDQVFSTQSDIWAFGIVLWEMFSLAKTPYPGIQFGPKLFNKLLEGYRMEKPQYATDEVYTLMRECWNEEPMSRPCFTKCAERLGNMLEESVKQHYIDLNDPYLQLNSHIYSQTDYLSMLNAPTFANFCSVNGENGENGGYLNMQRTSSETGDETEMKPMLNSGNNYITPVGLKSFLNPGYEGLNKLKENTYVNVPQQDTIQL